MIFHLTSLWWLFAICPIAYFIGNFNCTKFLCKYVFHDDYTKVGSGNPGATNALRMHGTKWFFIVFFVDAGKGALSALIAMLCYGYTGETALVAMLAMGLAVVVGTVYPVLYKFKGSKAVSTMVGAAWFINPMVITILFFVFMAFIFIVRIVSIASILGISSWILCSILIDFLPPDRSAEMTLTTILMYCSFILILLWTHRTNLVRIFKWQEKRVSFGKKKTQVDDNKTK